MKVFFSPKYTPAGHKTIASHWTLYKPEQVFESMQKSGLPMDYTEVQRPMDREGLQKFHFPLYIDSMENGHRDEFVTAAYRSQGQLEACKAAYENKGCTFNLASGFHHAEPGQYLGFCMFNGLVLAHCGLKETYPGIRTAVLDLDAHYGNGCRTYSHQGEGFAHFDVSTTDASTFDRYMALVETKFARIAVFKPDIVEYNAGMDVLAGDDIGDGFLSLEQAKIRDREVLQFCKKNGFPVAVCLAGGYQPAAIEGHISTYKEALRIFEGIEAK